MRVENVRDVMIKSHTDQENNETKKDRGRRGGEREELGEAQIAHKKKIIKATCHALKSRGVTAAV